MAVSLVTTLCLVAFVCCVASTNVTIDKASTDCGKKLDVVAATPLVVTGRGNGVASCQVTLTAEIKNGCIGLCYNITNATFVAGSKLSGENSLTIATDVDTRTFKHTNPYIGTVCTRTRTLALSVTGNTEGTEAAPTFTFEVEIYNNCPTSANSVLYDEAIKSLEGYQHKEIFEAAEMTSYFKGLAIGLGLAGAWLVLLFSGFLYMKCRPHAARKYAESRPAVLEEKLPLTEEA